MAKAEAQKPPRHEHGKGKGKHAPREARPQRPHATEAGKQTWRLEVGHVHGVKPGNIIGAIANEAGLDSQYIGRLSIRDDHSLIDLPEGMPKELVQHLKKVRVVGQMLQLKAHQDGGTSGPRKPARGSHPKAGKNAAHGTRPPRRKS